MAVWRPAGTGVTVHRPVLKIQARLVLDRFRELTHRFRINPHDDRRLTPPQEGGTHRGGRREHDLPPR